MLLRPSTFFNCLVYLSQAFNMHRMVKKLLLLFIFIAPKLEKVFGMSEFRYKNKQIKVFTLYSRVIIISFIILYPFSCVTTLSFFQSSALDVTMYARIMTFVFNWLVLVFIYANEAIKVDYYRGLESITRRFCKLIMLQSGKDNLILLSRCTLKVTVVFAALCRANFWKYLRNARPGLSIWEQALMMLLLIPFVIMALASNRIYVVNTVAKHYLSMYAEALKSSSSSNALKIKLCAMNYQCVNIFFDRFNKLNAINLLVILGFCILNIVYEVNNTDCGLCAKNLKLECPFQTYFFYLHFSNTHGLKSFIVAVVCITLVVSYLIELIFTIRIYDDIKKTSSNFYNDVKLSSHSCNNKVSL